MDSPGDRDLDVRCVAQPGVNPSQGGIERPILTDRDRWNTAGAVEDIGRDADAGARVLGVPRPRIGGIGIEQAVYLVQQRGIGALAGVILMQCRWDCCGIDGIDDRTSGDGIGTLPYVKQICRQPVRSDLTIGVGAKQDTVRRYFTGCEVHRQATRLTRGLLPRRKLMLNDVERKLQRWLQAASDRRRWIG